MTRKRPMSLRRFITLWIFAWSCFLLAGVIDLLTGHGSNELQIAIGLILLIHMPAIVNVLQRRIHGR